MAVAQVGEIWERRRSTYRDNVLVHYLVWKVICDNMNDGPAMAIGASGIPAPGDAYVDVYGNVAYLAGIDANPFNAAPNVFEVQVEFDTLSPTAPDDNPLNAPMTVAWSYSESTEPYFIDASTTGPNGGGEPVVNAAGEPFETLPTRDRGDLVITVGLNSATHDAVAADALSNTTNLAPFVIDTDTYAPGTLRLKPIAAVKSEKTLRDGTVVNYYAKTLTFMARHQGWLDSPLNVGFNELVGNATMNTQTLRRIVDSGGNPVRTSWPLDPSGHKLPNSTDPPQSLSFQPYAGADWTDVLVV